MATLAVAVSGIGARAQTPNAGLPIPETTRQSTIAIQRSFTQLSPLTATLFPEMREQLKDAPAFLRDAQVEFNIRSFYRDRVQTSPTGATVNEAWAGGGAVNFDSGRIFNVISGGFSLYTSLPLYAPSQYGNSELLLPGQQGYAVLGRLYGRLWLGDETHFTAGRTIWNTPFLDAHDDRMTPNTFYGYVLQSTIGDPADGNPSARFGGGYIATIKPRGANDFEPLARAAGANSDSGVGLGGGVLTWGPASIGAFEYFCQDTVNIAYIEGGYRTALPLGIEGVLAMQYVDQRSTGANLLNNGTYWSTGEFGAQLELGYDTAILSVAFSAVNPGFNTMHPWSSDPSYTSAQIQSFRRAGQQTIAAGLSWGLRPIGLPGVVASVFFYDGASNAPAAGAPLVENEWDFALEWRPYWKPLKGLWLRARYGRAELDQNNMRTTTDELRLVFNYNFKLY
jgi:hypothetical protein